MIAALDMQLALGTATGIGEYARGLAGALGELGVDVAELSEPRLDPWRFDRRVVWDQMLLPARARTSGAQLLHCLSGTMPLALPLPAVVTVHDVAWLRVQQHARPYARYYFGAFMLARYKHATAIVVDSAFSAGELGEVLDVPAGRMHVIHPGVARDFCALQHTFRERVVLIPGTVERRKNLEIAIRAIARIADVRIVSAGPRTPYQDECAALARDLGIADRVEFRGYVSRAEMLDLYATCMLVAVPSRYEGFGYAAAQALCAGTPLVVSDRASLPEVCAGDAPIAGADDVAAWQRQIETIAADPQAASARAGAVRARAIERFSWTASAQAALQVYRKTLALVDG